MGPDSSPKKLSLKEQRAAYLQWFALADEGLLSRRDAPASLPVEFPLLSRLADECVSLSFFYLIALAPERAEDGDGRLTGNDALRFFAMSNLSKPELKQVN
jgi:EH domain-containing protein 1